MFSFRFLIPISTMNYLIQIKRRDLLLGNVYGFATGAPQFISNSTMQKSFRPKHTISIKHLKCSNNWLSHWKVVILAHFTAKKSKRPKNVQINFKKKCLDHHWIRAANIFRWTSFIHSKIKYWTISVSSNVATAIKLH